MKKVDFHGTECVELTHGELSLLVTISVGPRILGLKLRDGENVLAVLPEATLDCPGAGTFHFYGGHRLWAAPEDPAVTYLPDDRAVRAEELENGVRLVQDPHERSPVQKTIEIRLEPGSRKAVIRHVLTNHAAEPLRLAPWAITQFPPGGIAILPQNAAWADNCFVLPNRQITFWPYTDVSSESIRWGNDAILIHARMNRGMMKIGYPNLAGWLGYWRAGTLFLKRAAYQSRAEYLDLGSSSECYCDARFLELETLGPVTNLQPGGCVEHTEVWSLHAGIEWTDDLEAIRAAAAEG